jgi:Anti-sigma-K factor rskA/Putative zinc-finger
VSARAPNGEHGDCGRELGAYVLDALDAGELERFRRHLAGCAVCRDELVALRSVVDLLPMAAPQLAAPRALRRRVLASVRAAPRAGPSAGAMRLPWRLRRPLARPLIAAMALAAAAAIAVGVAVGTSGSGHARLVTAQVSYASASATVRLQAGHAELLMRRMPAAPPGKIYEVWLKRGARPPTATSALFAVTSAGAAAVDVPGNLVGVSEVLVTPERLGGSARPTHAPVIVARIA